MASDGPSRSADDAGRIETVSEFTRRVKGVLEAGCPPCWVRGEVSNLRAQASGHVYFTLKDAGAQLACVLFRGDAARQAVALRDGGQVRAYGDVTVYEQRGQYQLVVRLLEEDGVGRLQLEFERLKQRLAAEGLFDPARKAPVPALPATVGFITSPTGAALQDFIRILARRGWRGRLVVLPARVQGAGAAAAWRTSGHSTRSPWCARSRRARCPSSRRWATRSTSRSATSRRMCGRRRRALRPS